MRARQVVTYSRAAAADNGGLSSKIRDRERSRKIAREREGGGGSGEGMPLVSFLPLYVALRSRVCARARIRVINISLILVSMTLMDDAAITSSSVENSRGSFIIKREELSTVEGD